MVILLMGVSGCGKTTVGKALAEELGWEFCDADWHHPRSNVEKMRAGIPLTEADRLPWLETLAGLVRGWIESGKGCVLACSALSARSREILRPERDAAAFRIVYLRGSRELIRERLQARHGHFMPPALLDSQFRALEEPEEAEGAVTIDIRDSPGTLVAEVRRRLGV